MDETLLSLALNFRRGFGPRLFISLIKKYQSLKEAVKHERINIDEELKKAEAEIEKSEKENVKIVTLLQKDYPQLLKQIPSPPIILYVKGEIPQDCIAVVGSRKTTPYGRRTAYRIGKFLAENGIATVSGLAYGIDTQAHKGTVDGGGKTVAVLGCGIDVDYPSGNRSLKGRILETGGALVTEFPFGTKPSRENFPRRNRIISGMSIATIVVEAREKSGSLITAAYANEQGRTVFAVPGNIDSEGSRGTNKLIREGAVPLTEMEDIFRELPYLDRRKKEVKIPKEFKPITELLSEHPIHVDKIVEKTGMPYSKVMEILLNLEIMGVVKGENGVFSLCV